MENNETRNKWLSEEVANMKTQTEYVELPGLKLVPNVVTEIDIDFSKPFEKWSGENNGKPVTKKIIPVSINGNLFHWWLNVKNPVYGEILKLGLQGQSRFRILQTGTQANTKYVIVK
jgi:hypothetical protein